MSGRGGWTCLAVAVLAAQGAARGAEHATAQGAELRPIRAVVVCSSSLMKGIRKSDAAVSLKSWMAVTGNRHRFRVDGQVVMTESYDETRRLVESGTPGILLLDSTEYLSLLPLGSLKAVATFSRAGSVGATYQLIARRGGGIRRVGDLSGKSINLSEKTAAGLSRMWLDVALSETGTGRLEAVAARVSDSGKPAAACLPVFFGTADACVVDKLEFDTMAELNPQIKVRLEVVATSPVLLESVIVMMNNFQDHREEVLEAMTTLHEEPQGKQMITLFKMERVALLDPAMLHTVRALRAKAQRLWQARGDGAGGGTI